LRFPSAQIPNVISSLRLLLIVPIAVALAHRDLRLCLGLFLVAAVSDALDGFLARRHGWQSAAGAILDPLADKLLVAVIFVTLTWMGCVPLWLTAVAVGRDLLIVCGGLAYRLCIGPVRIDPTVISKLNTLFQLGFIGVVVARLQFAGLPASLDTALGALVFTTMVVSGLDYVLSYTRRAVAAVAQRRTPRSAAARTSP
jgi:cardiolipin synthase